jgi:hypothetical protein
LFARLRETPPGDARQQIKWALFGFSGYAVFLASALAADAFKLQVGSFGSQLLLELLGGLSFGLAFLCLQLGLMVALLRFRLYDAEVVISRSATFALVTVFIGGIFAASNEAVKVFIQGLYGPNAGQSPGIFAAAVATVLVTPAQERIQRWSEQRFQRNLVRLREDLPSFLRELRESASIQELLDETLKRIESGVRTTRIAVLVDGAVAAARGIDAKSVKQWLKEFDPDSCLVGPRPDGSLLSKDEQNALVDVAAPITRAVRIVTRRELREKLLIERIEAIEAQLSKRPPRFAPKREKTVKR